MSGSLSPPNKNVSPIRCSEKPWDLWVSEIGHTSPLRDDDPSAAGKGGPGWRSAAPKRPASSGVTRLPLSSMRLYGQLPNTDLLDAAVCYMCGMTAKCSAAHGHLLEYHSSTVEPLLPPPPPAPTVKLKPSHSKSKSRKDAPLAEELLLPLPLSLPDQPPDIAAIPHIALTPQDISYFPELEVAAQKCSTQSEVKVSVDDNDLPVVSIQDNTDLPLADDIIEIMNSEGIQSIEDIPESDTTAWKNLMQDFGAIQDMTLQNTTLLAADGVSAHGLYDAGGTHVTVAGTTYTLTGDDGTLQYTQPITLAPTLAVDNQHLATFPLQPVRCVPAKPKPKPGKSTKSKFATREYDPNKHCGVITGEGLKPCTRSLTCKAHTLSLRRLVEGRVKSFDVLLAEHRAAKQASLADLAGPVLAGLAGPSLATLDLQSGLLVNHVIAAPAEVTNRLIAVSRVALVSPVTVCTQNISAPEPPSPAASPPRLPEPRPGDVCWRPSSPRPLATCTFSSCHMGSALLLGKRLATVRSNFKSTLAQSHSKSASSGYCNFGKSVSMSKAIHANNAATPEVRKLVVSCPALSGSPVKTEPGAYYGVRQNGRLYSSKRILLDDYDDMDTKCLRTAGPSVNSVRSKVSKHLNQSDMLELNLLFDPLMADEKC